MKAVDDRESTKPKKSSKRDIPQMPEGYYSGDKPNPNLRAFVEAHLQEKPYDPETDDYDVPAFDESITTTKATAIYNMHTYWSKKPHDALRQYIRHYTEEGDLVLDPFCGSGGTALAALMEGRKAIAIDRSPAATFITKNYCTPVDPDELQAAFEELKAKVKPEIDWLYETRCDRCGGKATTAYTVYSQVFQCPRCLEKVPLFDCMEVEGQTKAGKPKKIRVCPHCYEKGHLEEIRSQSEKFGAVPVLVNYLCENGCKPARGERRYNDLNPIKRAYFEKYDLKKIREIEQREIPYWYPKGYNMTNFSRYKRDALRLYNIKEVSDLFTKRNLWALSLIACSATYGRNSSLVDSILFTFSSILFKSSKMMAHNSDGIGRIQKGTYYIPQISHDVNVWNFLEEATSDMINGYRNISIKSTNLLVSTSNASNIDCLSNSVDYIFTDPPYAGKVQYGELNYTWEAWLDFETDWHAEEIIVNETRGITEAEWAKRMVKAFLEFYRVLKPGRCISICYHDTSEGTWQKMQDVMAEAGFITESIKSALFIDTKTKTQNQYFADKVNKRDIVVNFRKPYPGEISGLITISGEEDSRAFTEKARSIICDYLVEHPGVTKDRIYDELVSRMVRSGQMEAHDFEAALRRVAEPVSSGITSGSDRWYLKESEFDVVDHGEAVKEDTVAAMVAAFIRKNLDNNPGKEGVHYSDIFEYYIYAVKDKPRRSLADWLLDYFYKTDSGTYRLPATGDEEQVKREGRTKGLNRRIKRYLSLLEQALPIAEQERPDSATLTSWIHHCRRSGQYATGRTLYERGGIILDRLSEEQQLELEEDYLVCIRNIPENVKQNEKKRSEQATL